MRVQGLFLAVAVGLFGGIVEAKDPVLFFQDGQEQSALVSSAKHQRVRCVAENSALGQSLLAGHGEQGGVVPGKYPALVILQTPFGIEGVTDIKAALAALKVLEAAAVRPGATTPAARYRAARSALAAQAGRAPVSYPETDADGVSVVRTGWIQPEGTTNEVAAFVADVTKVAETKPKDAIAHMAAILGALLEYNRLQIPPAYEE